MAKAFITRITVGLATAAAIALALVNPARASSTGATVLLTRLHYEQSNAPRHVPRLPSDRTAHWRPEIPPTIAIVL